jgi:hypothetical protein
MRASQNKVSRLEILKRTIADLKEGHYTQTPQLEGEATVRKAIIA